jgi:predicted dienelactone hydrolase
LHTSGRRKGGALATLANDVTQSDALDLLLSVSGDWRVATTSLSIKAARLAALSALAIAILLGLLWWDHRSATVLPPPTGPFAVSRMIFDVVDHEQSDPLAPDPGAHRELVVWIWYPAADRSAAAAEYLPLRWRAAIANYRGTLITTFLNRDLSRVQAHSSAGYAVSTEQRAFPVVLMRPGASALTAEYAVLAEDLASHGYVVAGFDAPYRTQVVVLEDGRVFTRTPANDPDRYAGDELRRVASRLLEAWTADTAFVLDFLQELNAAGPTAVLAGHLDMTHVGMFGHSLGGATALQFCHVDPRCKTGIDVDGLALGSVVREALSKPFMLLMSDHSAEAADPETGRIEADLQGIYSRLPPGNRGHFAIQGANHYGFSDGALLRSPRLQRFLRMVGIIGMDGRRQLAITAAYVHSWFDVQLKGLPNSTLDQLSAIYPEVHTAN